MSTAPRSLETPGPFRTSHLREGDPYELANGHAIRCMGAGGRHAGQNQLGAQLLGTDPLVQEVGVDAAYRVFHDDKTLRAPDVSVGNVPSKPGWIDGVPGLALEYADTGQDEKELHSKIEDLLAGGTRYVWVVRLVGPQRIEVHQQGKPVQVVDAEGSVGAPGVLGNTYPVRSFFDRQQTQRLTLRNLLQQEGYESLDQVRDEGHKAGRDEGLDQGRDQGLKAEAQAALLELAEAFELALTSEQRAHVAQADLATLRALRATVLKTRRWPA